MFQHQGAALTMKVGNNTIKLIHLQTLCYRNPLPSLDICPSNNFYVDPTFDHDRDAGMTSFVNSSNKTENITN